MPCECGENYVGETKSPMEAQIKEHGTATKRQDLAKSASLVCSFGIYENLRLETCRESRYAPPHKAATPRLICFDLIG